MLKAIIFDFGGVLTSSCWDLDVMANIIRETFRNRGIELPKNFEDVFKSVMIEAWKRVVKTKQEEMIHEHIKETLEKLGFMVDEELISESVENIKEAPFCIVRPEAKRVLEELERKGYKMCIVSNSPIRFHDRVLEKHGLLRFFDDCIVVSCEVGYRKPDPKIFEVALNKLGVKPSEALYVGDVPFIDIPGAKSLGMKVAIMESPEPVIRNLPIPEITDPPPPDFKLRNLEDLLHIIRGFGGEDHG